MMIVIPRGARSGPELRSPRVATSVRTDTRATAKRTCTIDEARRRRKLAPIREKWERRATDLNRTIAAVEDVNVWDPDLPRLRSARKYAVNRVNKLNKPIRTRLQECGIESLPIVCGCGPTGSKIRCRQWWLCEDCRAKRSPSLGFDIRKGLDAALAQAVAQWGREGGRGTRPAIILITLTQRHSGDIAIDQQAISVGWRRLYKRLNEDEGRFPYVGVWEVTRGRDGLGHVHLHLAVVWGFRCWKRIRKQWKTACSSSDYITFVKKRRDGKESSAASVANYLGKYLSKGVDVGGFSSTMRADVSAAFYNQRSVLASVGFWRRREKCCPKCHERYRLGEGEPLADRFSSSPMHLVFHGLAPP